MGKKETAIKTWQKCNDECVSAQSVKDDCRFFSILLGNLDFNQAIRPLSVMSKYLWGTNDHSFILALRAHLDGNRQEAIHYYKYCVETSIIDDWPKGAAIQSLKALGENVK